MLKFIFWALLAVNAVLLAYSQGLLGKYKADEREPQRIRNQVNTDKLQLVSAATASAAPPAPAAEPLPAPLPAEEPRANLIACTEMGTLDASDARRFDSQLALLDLGPKVTRTESTVQEVTGHMVLIPPHANKEAADAKAAELKALGVSNFFIMNEATGAKWAISLGFFKSEAAAKTLLAALVKQGVTGAKVAGRASQVTKTLYRIRDIDAATRGKLEVIADRFPDLNTRACK